MGCDHGSLHERLLETAREMFEGDGADDPLRWAATITIAGSACDVAAAHSLAWVRGVDARRELPRLSVGDARKLDALLKSRKPVNLKPKGQRTMWRSMTGDKLSRWPDWIRYLRHMDRRDAIVHRGCLPGGRQPARADASDSLDILTSRISAPC